MGMVKVLIAITFIGIIEIFAMIKDEDDRRCFEISLSILMAAWILREGW